MQPKHKRELTEGDVNNLAAALQGVIAPALQGLEQAMNDLIDAFSISFGLIDFNNLPLFPTLAFYALAKAQNLEGVFLLGGEIWDLELDKAYALQPASRDEMLAVLQRIQAARARAVKLAPPRDEWLYAGDLPARWAYQEQVWRGIWRAVSSPARIAWGILKIRFSDKGNNYEQ